MTSIDPLLLGRPLRALEAMAAEIANAIEAAIGGGAHRELPVCVTQARLTPAPKRSEFTGVSVLVERETVLTYMALRHGFAAPEAAALPQPTATERRFSLRLRELVARATEEAFEPHALPQASDDKAEAPATAARAPGELHWLWRGQLTLGDAPARPLVVALDSAWSRALEHEAAQRRSQATGSSEGGGEPADAVLQMELSARLAEMTISAAALQALKPGTVLPITKGRAIGLINGAPLLKATVAEHQGKLHLTAFETLE